MKKDKLISKTALKRIIKYYRYIKLQDLDDESIISSYDLGKHLDINPSLIRQDLNALGEFGLQGHGYSIKTLKDRIGNFLDTNKTHNMIVLGSGNLGKTLARYDILDKINFPIKALFDINPKIIGVKINNLEILDLDKLEPFIKDNNIDIAILCVKRHCAQEMADILVKYGIKGIWNFSSANINVPEHIKVQDVNFTNSLYSLSYFLKDNVKNDQI